MCGGLTSLFTYNSNSHSISRYDFVVTIPMSDWVLREWSHDCFLFVFHPFAIIIIFLNDAVVDFWFTVCIWIIYSIFHGKTAYLICSCFNIYFVLTEFMSLTLSMTSINNAVCNIFVAQASSLLILPTVDFLLGTFRPLPIRVLSIQKQAIHNTKKRGEKTIIDKFY